MGAPRKTPGHDAKPSQSPNNPGHEPAPDAVQGVDPTLGDTAPGGSVVDRRLGIDRRSLEVDDGSNLDRRRGPGRRLSDFTRSAEEGEMTKEQFLFLMAVDAFKKANQRSFPTWTDVLEVIRLLGYRKTMPSELNLTNAEDWREPPNAPSGVRPDRWDERAA